MRSPRTRASAAPVLVMEDDPRLRHLLQVILDGAGFHVECDDDYRSITRRVQEARPSVVLFGMASATTALHALRELRSCGEEVPVLVLSGVADESTVLAAFEAGADDYVTKPFLPRVLAARVRALAKRAPVLERARDATTGGLALDPTTSEALVSGRRVRLSPTEFALLQTLMRGHGRPFTADELLASVWGEEYVGQDEIVRANIYRLRRKLESRPEEPQFIHGRRGLGYRFNPAVT